jgi:HAD superfamily hydrolase (TIGR01509 family)
MNCHAVLFDLGNTLIEYSLQGRWRQFLERRLAEVHGLLWPQPEGGGLSVEAFAVHAAEVIGGEGARELMHRGVSWHFRDRLREALTSFGLPCDEDHLAAATEAFYSPIRECTQIYPDTRGMLERLRADGLRLAVISNTPWDAPGYLTHGDMCRWDIDGYFSATVFSGDVPWRKPHPEFMLAAARALGVEPQVCVVVGDVLRADIAGANAAGMRSIWIDHPPTNEPWPQARADRTVKTIGEVVSALASL